MGEVKEVMCAGVCECYKGGIELMDVICAATLCKYDLRKNYLFVLSWERV